MTRKYSHERKKRIEERDKYRNYEPIDDIEDNDDDINELELDQLNKNVYIQYNPFMAFNPDYSNIIDSINAFRTISYDNDIKKTKVIINKVRNRPNVLIENKLNFILRLVVNKKGDEQKTVSIYKQGIISKQVKITLQQKFEEFFLKYTLTPDILLVPESINIIPIKITPSGTSNFYNMLTRSYRVQTTEIDRNTRQPIQKKFEEIFSLDDIDLMLSAGILIGKKYYFKIPTKVSNDKIYNDIIPIIKNKYGIYGPLLKWFDNNNYKYRLPILLFIDSYHDFSKKPSGSKDKLLQTEINNILRLPQGSTIMTYYTKEMLDKNNFNNRGNMFEYDTILNSLNDLKTPDERKTIFEILIDVTNQINGKAFEKTFLYLYLYYFYIVSETEGETVEEKISDFKEYYTFDITKIPKQQIKVDNGYAQDFLMKNESYRTREGKPVHFAVDNSKNFKYIPAALMDANRVTSSTNPNDYDNKEPIFDYDLGNIKILYNFDKDTDKCNLGVIGTIGDINNPNFTLYADQDCKGEKTEITYGNPDITEQPLSRSREKIYNLNDKLNSIEDTLLHRFNISDIRSLSENYIYFSNGSDGISKGDVLSLILAYSKNLYEINKQPSVQLIDKLLSLKRLGDFGQIMNCKQLDIPLFTQDSMENLLAIVTSTKTIFGNNPRYIYFNGTTIADNFNAKKRNYAPLDNIKHSIKRSRDQDLQNNTMIDQIQTSNFYKSSYSNILNNKNKLEEKYEQNKNKQIQELLTIYEKQYNKIFKDKKFKTDIAKWLQSRFNQITSNKVITQQCNHTNTINCTNDDKDIITKILTKYLRLLEKIDTLSQNKQLNDFVFYLFIKYDFYELINNFTSGYKYGNKNKTVILLETVLQQVLYDLDNMCQLNDNREGCKNIDDYINEYKEELQTDIRNENEKKYSNDSDEEYNNNIDYYKNTFNQFENKKYLIVNKIRSRKTYRKSNIKSSRDNLRKQRR